MMKHEFEDLIGQTLADDEYNCLEKCYMTFNSLFPTKQAVADFYKVNGMAAFNALYTELIFLDVDVSAMASLRAENYSLKEERDRFSAENDFLKCRLNFYVKALSCMEDIFLELKSF